MIDKNQIEKWAYDGAPTKTLRALCRAWLHADLLPQNCGQYRAVVVEPAIDEAVSDAIARGLLTPNAKVKRPRWHNRAG